MKTKEQKRKEAIARNGRHWANYTRQGYEKGLRGAKLLAFVDHKIGIPRSTMELQNAT